MESRLDRIKLLRKQARVSIALHGIFIDLIHHDTRSQIVRLVEQQRFPCLVDGFSIGSAPTMPAITLSFSAVVSKRSKFRMACFTSMRLL